MVTTAGAPGAPAARVHGAVADALARHERVVLAVSGGLDSMVLLEAAAMVAAPRIAAVATFDHGTGEAARRAAAHVERRARELGLPFRGGRAVRALAGEAAWREARWAFLRAVARELEATIATAHTDDDQLETVAMRILRGAGARGLAALLAPSDVERPFLAMSRAELAEYARARGVAWVVDPSNASRAHFRNRVRLDLLPALRRVHPSIDDELRAIARRAAHWRREVDGALGALPARVTAAGTLRVAADALDGYDRESLRVMWPALAARVGARLDRRGTHRLAEFTMSCSRGTMPLSGGWEVARTPAAFEVRRTMPVADGERTLRGEVRLGRFRFRPLAPDAVMSPDDRWWAALPADAALRVRAWRPGDRLTAAGAEAPRRVKRFLSDAGIAGPERQGWPVVLADEHVVWIPGVRRSDAATDRSGRPFIPYRCERLDR